MRPGSRPFFLLTKPALFVVCLLPLAHMALGAFGLGGVDLGANPVERIQDTFGVWGLRLLLITLAVTPLQRLTGWLWLVGYRRMLGLFAFFYVVAHLATYLVLDLGLDFAHLGEDIVKRPFITIGMVALLLLVPLAVTSTRGWQRRLGKRWKQLHRLVYPAAILGVWHFYWQVKLDTAEPTIYAVILALLLGWRLWLWRRLRTRRLAAAALLVTSVSVVPAVSAVDLQFTRVSDRDEVVDIRHAGDGSNRLFLVGQRGQVWILSDGVERGEPFLDISGRISSGGERGLLSMAFDPDYVESGVFYTWYTGPEGNTFLTRFRVSGDPDVADSASEEVLLEIEQPFPNHNGGRLQFGPDGYLYLGVGDGGGSGDPGRNGQDPGTLLGTIIRLDVDPGQEGYRIPPDNPFVGLDGARPEIWALGLRNPWRISFDHATTDLYIADVGQAALEEINHQAATSAGGENYGWSVMEGTQCYREANCDPSGLVLPVAEYSHAVGCSVTGGEVYRGHAYPALHGRYLYADYCSGRIWSLHENDGAWISEQLVDTDFNVVAFGLGEDRSLYLSALGEGVFRVSDGDVVPEPAPLQINPGLNDAWFELETAGQGFFIVVFPDTGLVFLAWFTFDVERPPEEATAVLGEAGHRWLTALGTWEGDTVNLDVELTSGGIFDSAQPAVQQTGGYGRITIVFHDCTRATLYYDLPEAGLSGTIELGRLAADNVALCETLAGARVTVAGSKAPARRLALEPTGQ